MATYSPGTDAALVAVAVRVLINENLVDQPFLDKYCVGYDEKTLPADAPKMVTIKPIFLVKETTKQRKNVGGLRKVPVSRWDRIIKLAREIADSKNPLYLRGLGAATPEQTVS